MKTFNKGDRVKYIKTGKERSGREGLVQDSYRDYDGERVVVLFDGEGTAWSFDDEDFELAKETYVIEMWGEDSTIAVMELTPSEVALIERMIEQFENTPVDYAPSMTINKEKTK